MALTTLTAKVLYIVQRPLTREMIGAGSIGLVMMCCMTTFGFPAVALPQMDADNSTITFSPEQASWFATVTLLWCAPGGVLGGVVCEWMGPRRIMLLLCPVLFAVTAVMAAAPWSLVLQAGAGEALLLSARVMQGLTVAILNPVACLYTYEVTERDLRGPMTGMLEVWATLGFLLMYLLGALLPWPTIAWVSALVTLVPAYFGLLVTPESPMWLARNGREAEAKAALAVLRSSPEEAADELRMVKEVKKEETKKAVEGETRDVQREEANEEKKKEITSEIKKIDSKDVGVRSTLTKPNVLAMFAAAMIMVTKEMSGNTVISIYIVYIFQLANVGLDPGWSSVLVGCSRLVFNIISSALLFRLPRKPMLSAGAILAGVSTAVLGTFFYLQSSGYDTTHLGWLPLVSLVIYMIGYAGAEGPLCWLISVEVLPGPIRSFGCGINNAVYALAAFACSKTFPDVQAIIGLHGAFWSYSVFTFACLVFVLVFVPETKGKSLDEVEQYWHNKCRRDKEQV